MLLLLCVVGLFTGLTKVVMNELESTSAKKNGLYYNGTAYFDATVIYISLDGFRNDYLDRKVTPNIHLLGLSMHKQHTKNHTNDFSLIAEQGIRAEYMNPSFPVSFLYTNVIHLIFMHIKSL